ncbi:MAG: sugar phosphate nucleotidyltransferase [Prosthecobacter sp.]
MNQAFVLGAGMGERLRPLTEQLPKPLVPVFHRPLITYAFDHLIAAGVSRLVVNTHHIPEAYERAFPKGSYRDVPIQFRNESPVRLETAGGIANVRDLLGSEPFLVYNGDILTDLPLQPLLTEHCEKDNLVTLVLRSHGPSLHIAFDPTGGRVTDIRNKLGTGDEGKYLFTGIYACSPAIHDWITPGKVESVIPVFLEMLRKGAKLGAVVIDEGSWWDLGSRTAYLAAHGALNGMYGPALDPGARIEGGSILRGTNVVGADAVIESGAQLEDTIVWPGGRVVRGAELKRCIVRSGITAAGIVEDADF